MDWLMKRPSCWERLRAGGEGDDRGWDGWMASPTQCTWVWVSSCSWWWTGRPGMLQSMGLQRVGHDWVTKLNWLIKILVKKRSCFEGSGHVVKRILSCLINLVSDPMDCSSPGSSVHGNFQARTSEPVAISFSRGSSWPRDRAQVSCIFCIGRRILYQYTTWEAPTHNAWEEAISKRRAGVQPGHDCSDLWLGGMGVAGLQGLMVVEQSFPSVRGSQVRGFWRPVLMRKWIPYLLYF